MVLNLVDFLIFNEKLKRSDMSLSCGYVWAYFVHECLPGHAAYVNSSIK